MNEQTVSVAMCTFNGSSYLREQLESIACQTLSPRELVVCDDHSSDNTIQILREFATTTPFPVRLYINDSRLGLNKNFERAISLCEGDLIALSDQDDVWYPDKLRKSVRALLARPEAIMVYTNADVVDNELRPLGFRTWDAYGFGARERKVFKGRLFELLLRRRFVAGAATVFRSEVRDLILPIPDDFQHNHDGWIAFLVAACSNVVLLDESLMAWRRHHGQWTDPANLPLAATPPMIRGLYTKKLHLRGYIGNEPLLEEILVRLSATSETYPRIKRTQRLLQDILTHNGTRRSLPRQRYKRLPYVARELVTFRYRRFSHGFRSAVRDLLA
jgi:glycosyltransferase involved in cell wall biosynthesis